MLKCLVETFVCDFVPEWVSGMLGLRYAIWTWDSESVSGSEEGLVASLACLCGEGVICVQICTLYISCHHE